MEADRTIGDTKVLEERMEREGAKRLKKADMME